MSRGLLLDLDGTVRTTLSGKPTPDSPEDQKVLPGRKEKIDAYKKDGYKIVGITNQGGVALGHVTHAQVKKVLFHLNDELGRPFDELLYCAAHPTSNDPRRKPNPGMIHEAAKKHRLDLSRSLMVGDMETDEQAAKAAGVPFQWAHEFFGDPA